MWPPWSRPRRRRDAGACPRIHRPDLGVCKKVRTLLRLTGLLISRAGSPGILELAGGEKPSKQAVIPPLKGDVR